MEQPLVSVLMTAYNREKYIAEGIESVLSSSYTNFELIICDDCSKDKTVEIAGAYADKDKRVKVYINEKNLGDYNNRNKAASYAKGEYLKFLDSDDTIYEHGLKIFIESMQSHPEAALGLSSRQQHKYSKFPILLQPIEAYHTHFFIDGFFHNGPSASIIKTSVFNKLEGFSGKRYVGDFELWLKIAMHYPVLELHPSLIFWRQHPEQEIKNENKNRNDQISLNLSVLTDVLNCKDCPLTQSEKKRIFTKERKGIWRYLMSNAIKKGKISDAFKHYKEWKLKIKDIL